MASKGFFCFSLALLFALTTMALSDAALVSRQKIMEAKTIALSLEQGSMKRFEIEQNADKAIALAMQKSLLLGENSPEAVKQQTDKALWELFEKEKKQSKEKIEFYSTNASGEQYPRIGQLKKKLLEKKDLENNSKTIVLGINAELLGVPVSAFVAEYSVTGGLLKNKTIFASLDSGKSSQEFILPIDYSNKTMVVK